MKNVKINRIILILFFISFKLFSMEIEESSNNLKQDINLLAKRVQDTYDNRNNNINMIESKKKFDPIKGQYKRLNIILKHEDIDTKIKLLYKFIFDSNIDLSKFILEYLLGIYGYELIINNKYNENLFDDLLKNKILDLNKQYLDGKTILMYAIEKDHLGFAQTLLRNYDLDLNKQDFNGDTALMYLARFDLGRTPKDVIKLVKLRSILNAMLHKGINVNIVNKNNKLAKDIAKENFKDLNFFAEKNL